MHRFVPRYFVAVFCVLFALALLPGCKQAPKEEKEEPVAAVDENALAVGPLDALKLPVVNDEIGITLNTVPAGLVPTYNGEHWIDIVDDNRRALHYTFVSAPEFVLGIGGSDPEDFEKTARTIPEGGFLGKGELETTLGVAGWANGSYSEDGVMTDQIFLLAPHPSGTGSLILTSTCTVGEATVEERLKVMGNLLAAIT